MDKAQGLHLFWSGFGVPAIDENSAYDEKVLEQLGIGDKRITYEYAEANLGEPQMLTANIWDRSTSWTWITNKAKEITSRIGWGGIIFPVDGGYLKIMLPQNTIILRRMSDEQDSMRRISINIMVDFLTAT